MKSAAQTLLLILAVGLTVNLLISCAPGHGPLENYAPVPSPAVRGKDPTSATDSPTDTTGTGELPGGVANSAEGTSDSGGGTGIDGKVLESYIVDPEQLPAFKSFVAPLLSNLEGSEKVKNSNRPKTTQIMKYKTWYMAPVELTKISKDALGISFVKSATQQIAIQTLKAVWMDQRIYDSMSMQEQGEFLLHEFVMSLYFMKFMTMEELCRASVLTVSGSANCDLASHAFDAVSPSEPPRPLNDEDNENIRFVTGWIKQNAQKPIERNDFFHLLLQKGFDKRFFSYKNSNTKDLMISQKELIQAIKGSELTGKMPSRCEGKVRGLAKSCRLGFEWDPKTRRMTLTLQIDDEEKIELSILVADEQLIPNSVDYEGRETYVMSFADMRHKLRVGDKIYSGFLLFRIDEGSWGKAVSLDSVIIKSGLIVSIDRKRDKICQLRAPKAVKFVDDVIMIRQEDAKPNFIEAIFALQPPFSACYADNVEE